MYNVVSLFSGCGGGDVGLKGGFEFLGKKYEKLPFKHVYANEYDAKIAEIFNANFDIEADVRDIREVPEEDIPQHDILVGGFPCNSFSIVAQNPKRLGIKNDDGKLFFEMVRMLKKWQPKAFIAENVKGILSANKGEAFPLIIKEFEESGYIVKHCVLNAADFGVPQRRYRVIIVGIRKDIETEYEFPLFTHSEDDGLFGEKHIPLKEIIFPEEEIDEKYYFSERAVQGMLRAKKEMNKGRAQDINKPCNTVGAHLAKVSLNSTDPVLKINGRYRRFTPREVARIQSFPDTFNLVRAEGTQYKALGNAIPPVLMWHVAKKLAEALGKENIIREAAVL
ncbi:DNA (cytosine-5-)-methyltransferase [Oceanobacillus piezotolerans]|uniref:Cytosine-specific methyltransferase n=1 Tax=Oceanobacillus piezotolerans TaxID=2448030 RepID=A0A498DAF6_9BACI|nr:DNA (cytosine-5-)-methyltransferase [Oceanobacillus piezotolerans]RLL43910.1 DNA (cytosine-5-)-methyltransferase [Oceanobacillus piezotolerans]